MLQKSVSNNGINTIFLLPIDSCNPYFNKIYDHRESQEASINHEYILTLKNLRIDAKDVNTVPVGQGVNAGYAHFVSEGDDVIDDVGVFDRSIFSFIEIN